MPEICLCKIPEAYVIDNGMNYCANLYIPENPDTYDKPFDQDKAFSSYAVNQLREKGTAKIATPEQPLKPPSAGVLDVLVDSDGEIKYVVMFEKDKGSKRTPGYHTTFHGYPQSKEDWFSLDHGGREAAEEVLYVSDGLPLVPAINNGITKNEMKNIIKKSRKGGYDIDISPDRIALFESEILTNPDMDVIKIFNHEGDCWEYRGSFSWYPFVDMINTRAIDLPVEGLMVYDLEGFWRDAVLIKPEELKNKYFGDTIPALVMENPKDENGIPVPGERTKTEKEIIFKPIPAAIATLHDLGIYPRDWIDEQFYPYATRSANGKE